MMNRLLRAEAPASLARDRVCIECGAPMRERIRWQHGDVLYTCFECTRAGCPAKTLDRTDLSSGPALPRLRRVSRAAMLL